MLLMHPFFVRFFLQAAMEEALQAGLDASELKHVKVRVPVTFRRNDGKP